MKIEKLASLSPSQSTYCPFHSVAHQSSGKEHQCAAKLAQQCPARERTPPNMQKHTPKLQKVNTFQQPNSSKR